MAVVQSAIGQSAPFVNVATQQTAFNPHRVYDLPVYASTAGLVLFTGYEKDLGQIIVSTVAGGSPPVMRISTASWYIPARL